MNIKKVIKVLKAGVKSKRPILLVGKPGIGKTDMVGQVSKALACGLITMHPVVSDPIDFKGLPANVNGLAEFLPYGDLRRLIEAEELTICFIDDLGQAPMAVQAAAMQLVLAREINGQKISDNVVFIAATNSRKDRAGVTGLINPLINRFTVIEVEADVESFCQWALTDGNLPTEIVAYVQFRPDMFNDYKPTNDIVNFPSPRGITTAARWYQDGIDDQEVLAGACGSVYATDLCAFLEQYKELAGLPQEVILNPSSARIPAKLSARYAIAVALAGQADESSLDACLTYLGRISDEFGTLFLKAVTTRNPELAQTDAFINWNVKKQANLV